MRLRYWVKESFTVIAATIGGSALYTFLMCLSDIGFEEGPLFMGLIYLICFGGFMGLIMNVVAHNQHLPLALSFGSSRKEAMVGMQIFRLLPGLVISIVAAILSCVMQGGFQAKYLLIAALSMAAMVTLGTWGSFMGIAYSRFGAKAVAAVVVIGLLFIGGCAAAVIVAAVRSGADAIFDAIFSHPLFPWALGLIPLAFYGLSLIPERKAIYTYSVKL